MVDKELVEFAPNTIDTSEILDSARIQTLPPLIRKWLKRSNVVGKPVAQLINLKQTGLMRTSPDNEWMPFNAEQFFSVSQPGFIWVAVAEVARYIHISARDKYENSQGNMLIKLLSLFTIADSKGAEIDQGSLLRFMAEIIWFPSAAVSDYLSWDQIDTNKVQVTMSYGAITASGIYYFNENGEVTAFEAMRYYDRNDGATLEKWFIQNDIGSIKEFDGIRIPTKSEVIWKLDSGDFNWLKLEIQDVS